VIINYTQVGNTDFIAAGKQIPDGMFMRYHIDSISNNDTNAHSFHFDPSKIFAQSQSNNPIHHPCIPGDATPVDIAPHTSSTGELLGVTMKIPGDPSSRQAALPDQAETAGVPLRSANHASIAFGCPLHSHR
jgi:hypothetical protein